MNKVYSSSKSRKGKLPWELPEVKRSFNGTIFSQRFLSITIDEIHEFRNMGMKYFGALGVLRQGVLKFGLTGTPLLTSPKARIGFFCLNWFQLIW